jgi:hypothetical protein
VETSWRQLPLRLQYCDRENWMVDDALYAEMSWIGTSVEHLGFYPTN